MSQPLKSRGSILILALWSLSLLSIFTISIGFGARQKATLLQRLDALNTLYPLAYSGIEKAKGLLLTKADSTPQLDTLFDEVFANPDLFKEMKLGNGAFSVVYESVDRKKGTPIEIYGVVDEERKINVNTADAPTLARLFEKLGNIDKDSADEIAYGLVDWRDSDSTFQHPSYGAEDDTYGDLTDPYEAKDMPFEVIDELLLVKGVNPDIFARLAPWVTVYGQGVVNINTASAEVLEAFMPGLGDKVLTYRKGKDQEEGTADDQYFSSAAGMIATFKGAGTLNGVDEAALENLVSTGKFATISSFFTVKSKALLANGGSMAIEAVLDRTGKVYFLRTTN